jgi:CheY-like chemotaxis protein
LGLARDQALQGSRLKSEFVANISHEIRTPISAVIGMNTLLLHTNLDERQKEFAKLANESALSLLTIINDILDFSKMEAGKLEINSVKFSLGSVMSEVLGTLAPLVNAKGLTMLSIVDANLSEKLRGDPVRLRQVLINLGGNAIKFTAAGEVLIHAQAVKDEQGFDRVRFMVKDTGIGIPEEQQQRLFKPFVQADGSTTRRYGGTGLGLSISKRLVELMGGEINVDSTENKGSTFWFDLPAWVNPHDEHSVPADIVSTNKQIVLFSRNELYPPALAEYLKNAGIGSMRVSSVNEIQGIVDDAASKNREDILLVDSTTAPDLKESLNADSPLANLPIMVIRGSEADQLTVPAKLKVTYLDSPLTEEQLLRALQTSEGRELESGKQPIPAVPVEVLPAPAGEKNLSATSILVAEDSPVLQTLVRQLLKKLGCTATIVSNGREAAELAVKNDYNLIFMDWQMPEMDGLEATAQIRASEASTHKHTPIIAMTANAMQGDKDRCLAAGMDGYLSKPFKIDELKAIIDQYSG